VNTKIIGASLGAIALIIPLLVLAALLLAAGMWWFAAQRNNVVSEQADSESPAVSGELMPDISLTDFEGKTVHLADFAGRPLVINSWAAWCPFCVKELSDFAIVQQEFGDRVVIIAVDRAESREAAKGFTDGIGVTDDLMFLLDPDDSFYRAIGGFSMPETIFVKANGTIDFHKHGPMTVEEIRQRTQELVQ